MSDVIISVENLGKKYAIQHQQQRQRSNYKSLRETITQKARGLVTGWNRRGSEAAKAKTREDFWALRDVSFELQRGRVLGIIGRNGAGKSTLLKILSRITEPSEGRVTLRGRVASLLEVGTGFHPELTGRENIFLNGSILGMTHAEIKRKFDEIVDFAEVEKFLDTPVKRYSSGMYVRLAFAVAAHLEPEILIVDEVLAVGDTQFQAKCMGKMQDVAAHEGRTVLFVSHNLPSILRLCALCCWLSSGHIKDFGATRDVVSSYLHSSGNQSQEWARLDPPLDGAPHITRIMIQNAAAPASGTITVNDPISIDIQITNPGEPKMFQVATRVSTGDGLPVFTTTSSDASSELTLLPSGVTRFGFTIPSGFLPSGIYRLICAILVPGGALVDVVADQVGLEIHQGLNHATFFPDNRLGMVTPLLEWHTTPSDCTSRGEAKHV